MKFGFIGAGRAGTAVAGYFKQQGLEVAGFYNRSLSAAVDSAILTDTKAFLSLEELFAQSDVLVIAVSDDAIRKFAVTLAKWDLRDKILCHLSGSYPAACLEAGTGGTATYLALHPLANFTSKYPPDTLTFALEGNGPRVSQLQTVFKQHNIGIFPMSLDQIAVFYIGMSFLSSFVTTMAGIGRDLLRSVGIYDCSPFQAMLTDNFRNALTAPNIRDVMTGPVVTEDINALKRQTHALNAVPEDVARLFLHLTVKSMSYSRLDNYAKLRMRKILQSDI